MISTFTNQAIQQSPIQFGGFGDGLKRRLQTAKEVAEQKIDEFKSGERKLPVVKEKDKRAEVVALETQRKALQDALDALKERVRDLKEDVAKLELDYESTEFVQFAATGSEKLELLNKMDQMRPALAAKRQERDEQEARLIAKKPLADQKIEDFTRRIDTLKMLIAVAEAKEGDLSGLKDLKNEKEGKTREDALDDL